MSEQEKRVRDRAYQLWEAAGRPHHREHEFWHRANEEIAAEPVADAGSDAIYPAGPASPPTGTAGASNGAKPPKQTVAAEIAQPKAEKAPKKSAAPKKPKKK